VSNATEKQSFAQKARGLQEPV